MIWMNRMIVFVNIDKNFAWRINLKIILHAMVYCPSVGCTIEDIVVVDTAAEAGVHHNTIRSYWVIGVALLP